MEMFWSSMLVPGLLSAAQLARGGILFFPALSLTADVLHALLVDRPQAGCSEAASADAL